jgi:hypothetical protein
LIAFWSDLPFPLSLSFHTLPKRREERGERREGREEGREEREEREGRREERGEREGVRREERE